MTRAARPVSGQSKRGGARPGAGRKPIGGSTGRSFSVVLPPEVEAEITEGLAEGETFASVLREGALLLVRARRVTA